MASPSPQAPLVYDALIIGGGIAGLWTLNRLQSAGYSALLVEAAGLGGEQTLASQGMIHGGLKYALRGQLTGASEAIAAMPDRWRACLDGNGEIDLTALEPRSEHYYLFAEASTLGKLTTFFASKSLRGRIDKLASADYPAAFTQGARPFKGVVYQLNDFVLDATDLLELLRTNHTERIFQAAVQPEQLALADRGVTLTHAGTHVEARRLILTAGAGTEALLQGLGRSAPAMQRRPLHQVVVRHRHPLPLHAHCLTGIRRSEPRLTITSHPDGDHWLWYLGGQLATDGVDRDTASQLAFARSELETCVPWLDWRDATFESLRVDRAEPATEGGSRPDQAFVHAEGAVVTGWPTKLSLVPDLGDQIMAALPPPDPSVGSALPTWPVAGMATLPWETNQ